MKAKLIFAIGLMGVFALQAYGQEGEIPPTRNADLSRAAVENCMGLDPKEWRHPDDKSTSTTQNALYSDALKAGQYEESLQALRWFYKNVPDFNPAIYINGVKIYEALATRQQDPELKKAYQDSVLWCYDQRITYFCDEDGKLRDYKALYNFKYNYTNGEAYPDIYEMYKYVHSVRGNNMLNINVVPYMTTTARLYDPIHYLEPTDVIDVYDNLTSVLEYQIENGLIERDKYEESQKKLDGLLVGVLPMDSAFIEENFCTKFQEDGSNVRLAKKLVAISLSNKATNTTCFIDAAKVVFNGDATEGMARTIADKHLGLQEYDSAIAWYERAIDMMEDNIRKSELYYSIANINRTKGLFSSARTAALKGIEEDPTNTKNFIMIGDLYTSSFARCKGGENIVHDRAVYIAAYNWYRKANDGPRMASARAQFPSKEEIFQYNMAEGQSYTVGCWVNETVSIQARN